MHCKAPIRWLIPLLAAAALVAAAPRAASADVFKKPSQIVDLVALPAPGENPGLLFLLQSGNLRHYFVVPNSGPTQLQFPTGMVFE